MVAKKLYALVVNVLTSIQLAVQTSIEIKFGYSYSSEQFYS